MKRLLIENIENFMYTLNDGANTYKFTFEFYNVKPKIGDILYINEHLLNYPFQLFSFGPIDGIYGRDIKDINDPDILVLNQDHNLIYLKRYYG